MNAYRARAPPCDRLFESRYVSRETLPRRNPLPSCHALTSLRFWEG